MRGRTGLADRTVMVTGGAGFIGAHLVRRLRAEGAARVVVLDSLAHGLHRLEGVDGIEIVRFTLGTDPAEALEEHLDGVELLFHFAAEKHRRGRGDALGCLRANVEGTGALLAAAARTGVRRVVFASSLYAYGRTQGQPMAESECPQPATAYGVSKLAGERLLAWARAQGGPEHTVLRYFFVYGPGQELGLGYPSVIVRTFDRLRAGEPPTIYGDGAQALDYVYVNDAVEAALLAADAPDGTLYNVGSGVATRIGELVGLMSRVAGRDLPPLHLPPDETAGTSRVADVQKARRELGFAARVPLLDGLARTWRWLSARITA